MVDDGSGRRRKDSCGFSCSGAITVAAGTVCHALPCSLNEDTVAPVERYFYPTPLSTATDINEERTGTSNGEETKDEHAAVVAAQFRGRGLLCAVSNRHPRNQDPPSFTTTLPSDVAGVVLVPSSFSGRASVGAASGGDCTSGSGRERELQLAESFRHLYEWRHEHNPSKVVDAQGRVVGGHNTKGGLEAAMDWCRLARAVHDPIDVIQP